MVHTKRKKLLPAHLPREKRFLDFRRDRYAGMEWNRNSMYKIYRQDISKRCAPLFKAVREDRRFAGPHLAAALIEQMGLWPVSAIIGCQLILNAQHDVMKVDPTWEYIDGLEHWSLVLTAAHPSLKDPTKIACYPTRADAARKREVVLSPGKFFASVLLPPDPAMVQSRAENYIASKTPLKVHFVDNNEPDCCPGELSDWWARIYRSARGFSSCMVDFAYDNHPARFYAYKGNNLALAYITYNGLPDGEVTARAIVNTKNKNYVRIYGDGRLCAALEKDHGMEHNGYAALNGVKCHAESGSDLRAPYIDWEMGIQWDGCTDYCKIVGEGYGNYTAQETNGYAGGANSTMCDECEDCFGEDEIEFTSYHDMNLCSRCAERYFTRAYVSLHNTELVREDETVEIDGDHYVDDSSVLALHGYRYSEYHDEYIHNDDAVYLSYRDEYVKEDDVVGLDISHGSDNFALEQDTKLIMFGGEEKRVHEDYAGLEDCTDETEDHEYAQQTLAA